MHLPTAEQQQGPGGAKAAAQQQQQQQAECKDRSIPLSDSPVPEYQPYGIAQIQATSSKLTNRTDDKGMLICIIDSGMDAGHPDLRGDTLDGCKFEDSFAPAGCPFKWDQDLVGHGTHVAGTIAAQRNNEGVVGVIPGPAELYVVRVFNDSGDVNQGQGLVYGSTVILAFTQCEGRLAALQVAHPEKQYRMVVSMSLGAPGPLTIERMYFREAIKRGDILFVASSGNNGSSPTMLADGELTTDVNPGNYPGSYPEVIAVSAVDCANNLAPFSQKNPSVDLAAPGLHTLSTASRNDVLPGSMASGFTSVQPRIRVQSAGPRSSQLGSSGTGKVTGKIADCGTGSAPCPEAKDSICMVQYDPQINKQQTPNPSNPPATRGRATVGALASRLLGGGNSSAARVPPQQQQQGRGVQRGVLPQPTKFLCDTMEFCMRQGAKAMLVANPPLQSGFYGVPFATLDAVTRADVTSRIQDSPVFATFDCSSAKCSCWGRIKNTARLPAAGLSLRQYEEVKAAVAAAKKARRQFVGTVESKVGAYKYLSGTSMAVPHVTGAIARVWAVYPNCPATIVRAAFEQTAKDLGPKGKDVQFGHGLVQAEAAFEYLARQPCAKGQAAGALDADERTQLNQ
uniref:Peptidase S8/S53 domain-containing protein n=1 Tax=Tetradesmus obliquus TaxID=3088 RepID=A0A383W226_TETOB|eukprot:jgi/Sobl393_1/16451/SZX71183.1